MRRPFVIVIHGHPCTGKSFFLREIREALNIPAISRDEYKELLFDSMGLGDREWSMKLGATSWRLFFYGFNTLLCTGKSFAIEANFDPGRHRAEIKTKIETYRYRGTEIFLEAKPEALLQRFKQRWESGERHRGHVDHERYIDLKERLSNKDLEPLGVCDDLIRLDTTIFTAEATESLIKSLRELE